MRHHKKYAESRILLLSIAGASCADTRSRPGQGRLAVLNLAMLPRLTPRQTPLTGKCAHAEYSVAYCDSATKDTLGERAFAFSDAS